MPDFSWTKEHDLIQSRAIVHPALEALGFSFIRVDAAIRREQRPRSIAETADKRARIELIGPEDVIFKGTLMLSVPTKGGLQSPQLHQDLRQFLAILAPAWIDGQAWIDAQLTAQGTQVAAETQFRELVVSLKVTNDKKRLILGTTWQPGQEDTAD